jgi:formate-dependent phosphoribosylglycinamide formyltransferase (GAR transformylase)
MAHVCFVDASPTGLETLARALRLGHRVTLIRGTDAPTAPPASVHRLLEADTTEVASLAGAIEAVLAAEPLDAVLCQEETALEATATACAALGLRFTSADGVRNARDKGRARRLVAAAGLASARFAVVHDVEGAAAAASRIGFPVVVKPVSGFDSVLVRRADDGTGVRAAARAILEAATAPTRLGRQCARGVLVEEHLDGMLVWAELGRSADARRHQFMVSGRSSAAEDDCIEIGAEMPANLTRDQADRCLDYGEEVCRALGLDLGVFHIELLVTGRGPVLVEANPRMMAGFMPAVYQQVTGASMADAVLAIHLGQSITGALPRAGRVVTVRKLVLARDGRLAEGADLTWLTGANGHGARLVGDGVRPGAAVSRLQALGALLVEAPTWSAATVRADRLLAAVEAALQVPLLHPQTMQRSLRSQATGKSSELGIRPEKGG